MIRTGRSPHEIVLCLTAALVGVLGLAFGPGISPTVQQTVPPPWDTVYFLGLALSAIITLYGVWLYRVEGLLIERIGLGLQALLFVAYGIAILASRGLAEGAAAAAWVLAFAATHIARMVQIRKDLRALPDSLRAAVDRRERDHHDGHHDQDGAPR